MKHPSLSRVCACACIACSQNFCVMRHFFTIPALIVLLALGIPWNISAQEAKPAKTLAELQQQLSAHLSQAKFDAALWGVKVVSLDSGKVIFEQNAQKLFSPASNSKLYTVALALDRLGADYRIKTSLYATVKPRSGILNGDLIVFGRGGPTMNARLHNNDIYAALEPLVIALTNAGVQRITGDLIGDDSYFHGPPYGSGWAWDDPESYYGAEISALTARLQEQERELSEERAKHIETQSERTTLLRKTDELEQQLKQFRIEMAATRATLATAEQQAANQRV